MPKKAASSSSAKSVQATKRKNPATHSPMSTSSKRRKKHYAMRHISIKLYDEDAEHAEKIKEFTGFNNFAVWMFRVYYFQMEQLARKGIPAALQCLPGFAQVPIDQSTLIYTSEELALLRMQADLWERYQVAAAQVSKHTGKDVGIESLMIEVLTDQLNNHIHTTHGFKPRLP